MCATIRQIAVEAREIFFWVEGYGAFPVVDIEQFLEIEDLDVVVEGLGADDDVVFECPDFAP